MHLPKAEIRFKQPRKSGKLETMDLGLHRWHQASIAAACAGYSARLVQVPPMAVNWSSVPRERLCLVLPPQ